MYLSQLVTIMTERPNQQPESMRWDTGGTVSRMRAMLAEAGQAEDVEKDVLLQYMGVFNAMLGADDNKPPLSVIFDTGPDIYKRDAEGQPIPEADGLVRYGILERCIAYEEPGHDLIRLMAQIRLHANDRTDFDFDGAYYFELASFGDELSIGEARVHEIERPSLDIVTDDQLMYSKDDQRLGERLDYCANIVDEWRTEYLSDDTSTPIATLLNCFIDEIEGLPDDQAEQYMTEQSTALNLMLNSVHDELRLIALCNGVVENLGADSKPEGRLVQAVDMLVYAIDATWKDDTIKGYLYCIDVKGNLVRCQLGTDAVEIELSEGGFIDSEDD